MRRTTLALLLGAAMLTLAIAGCGGDDDDDDGGGAAEPTPTQTAAAGGGGDGDVATLVQDQEPQDFYRLNCSACHGQQREGITGLGLPLLPERLSESDDFYFETIKNGRAGTVMPAWGATGLTDPEIRAVLAFIRTAP
jgi:cytochrome c5